MVKSAIFQNGGRVAWLEYFMRHLIILTILGGLGFAFFMLTSTLGMLSPLIGIVGGAGIGFVFGAVDGYEKGINLLKSSDEIQYRGGK